MSWFGHACLATIPNQARLPMAWQASLDTKASAYK